MATEPTTVPPVVLLVEPLGPNHHHADLLKRAGLGVVQLPPHEVNVRLLDAMRPNVIAVELNGSGDSAALDLARGLREDAPPHSMPVPVIVYGHTLSPEDIERAARGGALWLQLEPSDGLKLVAAIRGVLSVAGIVVKSV